MFSDANNFSEIVAIAIAYFFAIVLALGLHEFAHAYASYKFGDDTPKLQGRLSINPFRHIDTLGLISLFVFGFGWAKPVNINPLKYRNYKLANVVVSLAGVITNFLLSFVASGLYFFLNIFISSTNMFIFLVKEFLLYSIIINLGLGIFNLLPIYPLDGFNFLKTFLSYENKFVTFMYRYGTIVLFVFLFTPIFDIIYSFFTNNILLGFIAFWGLFI